ncbi:acyltransferase [Microbacterium sp. zg.B185]|uniref:acyltransferase n=2 Tax=unclassified Microbacterium TaxID=2609290 RepID=UPI0035B64B67
MLRLGRRALYRITEAFTLRNLRRRGVTLGRNVRLHGAPICTLVGETNISLGDNVVLASRASSTALGVSQPVILRTLVEGAAITIGENTGLSGAVICAASRVSIGARVLIGSGVMIVDTDFHPLDMLPRRSAPAPVPTIADSVIVEDDVFIGARSIILKGSHIGRGSVIGAGSIVSGIIPEGVVAAGNPAKIIRPLRTGDSVDARSN